MKSRNRLTSGALTIVAPALLSMVALCQAQVVLPLSGLTTYAQNFDNLATATRPWVDGTTVPGWYAGINANNTPDGNLQATNGAGEPLSGLLNLGTEAATDRALGSKATGTGNFANIAFGVLFQNTSAFPLEITSIAYTGELWRTNSGMEGGTPVAEQWVTFYKISRTLFTDVEPGGNSAVASLGTFTALSALNWSSPTNSPAATALDGNAPGNRSTVATEPDITLNPGDYFMIRWVDPNLLGTDGYQGIDDFSITAVAVPEPAGGLLALFSAMSLLGRRVVG